MTDRSILERNKAVLWARDVISRIENCLVATRAQEDSDGISLRTMQGEEVVNCSLLTSGAVSLEEFTGYLRDKELVSIGLPDNLCVLLRGRGVVVHDALHYYGLYLNPIAPPVAVDVPPGDIVAWLNDSLTKMAGSSLVLDQADTGAGKWTSSHFKPAPGVLDRLRSMIQK